MTEATFTHVRGCKVCGNLFSQTLKDAMVAEKPGLCEKCLQPSEPVQHLPTEPCANCNGTGRTTKVTMTKRLIGVMAGNYDQFLAYCAENLVDPETDAFFIESEEDVFGKLDFRFVTYGTYYENQWLRKIQLLIRSKVADGDCVLG